MHWTEGAYKGLQITLLEVWLWPQHAWHLWAGRQPFSFTVVWIIGKSLTRYYFMATAAILPCAGASAGDASFPFNRMKTMWLWIIWFCLCRLNMSTFSVFDQLCYSSNWWQGSHLISTHRGCELSEAVNISLAKLLSSRGLLIFFILWFWLLLCPRYFADRRGTIIP